MNDAQLIAAWQQFRKAMGSVDTALAIALHAADSHNALECEALAALAAAPNRMLPMTELASTLGITSGGLTKLVDRLVQAAFVYRHHSAIDRRVIFAALTDQGAAYEHHGTADYATALRTELATGGSDRLAALREVCLMIEQRFTVHSELTDPFADSQPRPVSPPPSSPRRYPSVDARG